MDESIDDVRRELEHTRARLSNTVDELADRITHPVDVVRERLDVGRAAREHPWMALGIALGAGVLLGMTGTDARAARATAGAARRAGSATKDGALALVDRVRHRGDGAGTELPPRPGLLARLGDQLADALEAPLHELAGDLRRASRDIGGAARTTGI